MKENKSNIIEEIRNYISDHKLQEWDYYHIAEYAQYDPWVEAEQILELLKNTPATLEWDGNGLITLLPHKDFGFTFKLEIGFDFPDLPYSTVYVDESPVCGDDWDKSYERFIYLNNKYSDVVVSDDLKESLCNFVLQDDGSDEGFFVKRLLRSKEPRFLIDRANKLLLEKLTGSSWFKTGLVEGSIILKPDPGFGPPIDICYDGEIFKILKIRNEEWLYEEYGIFGALNKILDLINATITNGVIHRQSIYRKNIPKTVNNLMDQLLDKDFRDTDERCFIEMLLHERKVPESWFQKFSPNYEASSLKYYREILKERIFNSTFYLDIVIAVILSIGFLGSIFIFVFGKYELVMPYWDFIGTILAIAHLLAVGIVAFYCFDDLVVDMRRSDFGPISHQYGWFAVATACFPIGYPLGLIAKLISDSLTKRFESEFESQPGERIVYQLKDLAGPIPLGRIWIPTVLFGTFGTIYWYYLPHILKWVLS